MRHAFRRALSALSDTVGGTLTPAVEGPPANGAGPSLACRRPWRAPGQLALIAASLLAIALLFLPLTPMYDLNVFLRAGHSVLHGLAVYPNPGAPAVYSGSAFVYPYLASWPFVPLAMLPGGIARALFFLISACAVAGTAYLASGRDALVTALVLATAFTITGLQLGALSPLLLVGAVVLWYLRDRPVAFGLVAALVVASKLFLFPLLAWPLLAGRGRAFAWACCLTAAVLIGGFVLGPLGPAAYVRLLASLGTHEAKSGFSMTGALMSAGVGSLGSETLALALAALLLGFTYARFRGTGDELALYCSAVVASLIATPVLWSHYLALLAAGLLVLRAPRRWFVLLLVASWVISPPHGITIHISLSKDIPSHGAWLALGASLAVSAYVMLRKGKAGDAKAIAGEPEGTSGAGASVSEHADDRL